MDFKKLEQELPENTQLLSLSGKDAIHSNPEVAVDMSLGLSYGSSNKLLCLMHFTSFLRALSSISQIGYLGRESIYFVVVYNKETFKFKHLAHKSLAFGLGFNVFDYKDQDTDGANSKSMLEIIDRLPGPVCIFIEQ